MLERYEFLGVNLTKKIKARFKQAAAKRKKSMSQLAHRVIEDWLVENENMTQERSDDE